MALEVQTQLTVNQAEQIINGQVNQLARFATEDQRRRIQFSQDIGGRRNNLNQAGNSVSLGEIGERLRMALAGTPQEANGIPTIFEVGTVLHARLIVLRKQSLGEDLSDFNGMIEELSPALEVLRRTKPAQE